MTNNPPAISIVWRCSSSPVPANPTLAPRAMKTSENPATNAAVGKNTAQRRSSNSSKPTPETTPR